MNTNLPEQAKGRIIVSLQEFSNEIGISDTTAWRWRQRGWLKVINIAGRPYLTGEAQTEFLERAERGEFSKEPWINRANDRRV